MYTHVLNFMYKAIYLGWEKRKKLPYVILQILYWYIMCCLLHQNILFYGSFQVGIIYSRIAYSSVPYEFLCGPILRIPL